jgi:hypothetical protein
MVLNSSRRLALPIAIVALLVIPSASILFTGQGRANSLPSLAFGGNPHMTSQTPQALAIVGQAYDSSFTCSTPDNGSATWMLVTNSSWLAVVAGGTGFNYCALSGVPTTSSVVWANLTVNDTDSYDFVNWTIVVKQQGYWGSVQTLYDLPTGTHNPSDIALSSGRLRLITANSDQESVVLDGTLATLSRQNESNQTIVSYEPNHVDDGLGWNLSVEVYPARESASYTSVGMPTPTNGLKIYLCNDTLDLTAVSLYVGSASAGLERIQVLNASAGTWSSLTNNLIPSYPNRHDDSQGSPQLSESIYGFKPDRYTVFFSYVDDASTCNITITHTGDGIVGSASVPLPTAMPGDFKLRFVTDAQIPVVTPYGQLGYWMVDNLCFRGLNSRYPVAGPEYEYVTKGDPVWVSLEDIGGSSISDASVTIDGMHATYVAERQRYEADLVLPVDWNEPISYSVTSDGVTVNDTVSITMMANLTNEKISLPLWWNGWSWVSVFGTDDSPSATTAVSAYVGYNHPTTSYIMSATPGGNSAQLLATQSEVGIHWPHDYASWPSRFWDAAVNASDIGHTTLENAYTFASRWDNPAYVGVGDMYITIACPGNSASWEMLYAEYARGTRIMGLASNYANGAPGNHSLLGSWYGPAAVLQGPRWGAPDSQWYPYTQYDMMDAARGPNSDGPWPSQMWQDIFWTASHGGVQRFYNHGSVSPSPTVTMLLHWVDDPKTNFSYENWKATDGEVASYVYGHWSTDIVYNPSLSNSTVTSYQVSRADPIAAGYWRVPVTVAFNATGRHLADIKITEGNRTLLMSDGSLRNLSGKRIMDVGYDIRGNTIYVSYFWNASTNLSFVFSDAFPVPNTPPNASFIVDSYFGNTTQVFVFDASSSTDVQDPLGSLEFRWDWNGDGVWDTGWSSNPIAYHQFSTPGNYTVLLQVMDSGGLTGETQANVQVTDIEIPEMSNVLFGVVGIMAVFASVAYVSRTKRRKRP